MTPYSVMRVGRLVLVPYARPGSLELAEAVRLRARQGRALLLANHGPIVAGGSLDAASSAVEEVEEAAKLVLLLHGLPTRRLPRAAKVSKVISLDLVGWVFRRDRPNELWLTDITEHPTREGKLYPAQ